MPKEEIAMLSPILVTLGMIIPIAVGRITAGSKPMKVFLWGYPLRIVVTVIYLGVLPLTRLVSTVDRPGTRVWPNLFVAFGPPERGWEGGGRGSCDIGYFAALLHSNTDGEKRQPRLFFLFMYRP